NEALVAFVRRVANRGTQPGGVIGLCAHSAKSLSVRRQGSPSGEASRIQPCPSLVNLACIAAIVIDGHLLGAIVLPNQVRRPVTVEIRYAYCAPSRIPRAIQVCPALVVDRATGDAVIIHRDHLPCVVLPHHILHTLSFQIRPALVDPTTRTAVVIDRHLSRRIVLPYQIGYAIAIHVGHSNHLPTGISSRVQPSPAHIRWSRGIT